MAIKPGKEKMYSPDFPDRDDVILWDIRKIEDGTIARVEFLSQNSPNRQGVSLSTDKGIAVGFGGPDEIHPGVLVWQDKWPEPTTWKCLTDDGLLSIYNIYDKGSGVRSQMYGSGMIVTEEEGKLIYHCNDVGVEDVKFDSVVFSLEFITEEELLREKADSQ